MVIVTEHFSQFIAAAVKSPVTPPVVTRGGAGCPDAVFVDVGLTDDALVDIKEDWVNGLLSGSGVKGLANVMNLLAAGEKLQLLFQAHLETSDGAFSATSAVVINLEQDEGGTIKARVSTGAGETKATLKNWPPMARRLPACSRGRLPIWSFVAFQAVPTVKLS